MTKSRDQRSTVKAKYKDPNSVATWTRRGRTPAWVQGICDIEGIDIDGFKKDDRFRCQALKVKTWTSSKPKPPVNLKL